MLYYKGLWLFAGSTMIYDLLFAALGFLIVWEFNGNPFARRKGVKNAEIADEAEEEAEKSPEAPEAPDAPEVPAAPETPEKPAGGN